MTDNSGEWISFEYALMLFGMNDEFRPLPNEIISGSVRKVGFFEKENIKKYIKDDLLLFDNFFVDKGYVVHCNHGLHRAKTTSALLKITAVSLTDLLKRNKDVLSIHRRFHLENGETGLVNRPEIGTPQRSYHTVRTDTFDRVRIILSKEDDCIFITHEYIKALVRDFVPDASGSLLNSYAILLAPDERKSSDDSSDARYRRPPPRTVAKKGK